MLLFGRGCCGGLLFTLFLMRFWGVFGVLFISLFLMSFHGDELSLLIFRVIPHHFTTFFAYTFVVYHFSFVPDGQFCRF